MKKTFICLLTILLYGISSYSIASLPTNELSSAMGPADATEFTQLANYAELTALVEKQAEQYVNEFNMYNDMVKQGINITEQQFTEVSNDIAGVINVVKQGQTVSFASQTIAADFKAKYPGYQTSTDYEASYKNWSQSAMDSLQDALQAAGLQSQDFASEEEVLKKLRSMSESSQGRMEAIQVGNQVAVEQVAQTQKLRELVMAQTQSQSNYLASQQSDKDAKEAEMKDMLEYTERPKVDHKYFKGGTE